MLVSWASTTSHTTTGAGSGATAPSSPGAAAPSVPSTSIDYSSHGQNWLERSCSLGDSQSPINIDLASVSHTAAISYQLLNYQDITNATLVTHNEKTLIHIDYPNTVLSHMQVINELGHV